MSDPSPNLIDESDVETHIHNNLEFSEPEFQWTWNMRYPSETQAKFSSAAPDQPEGKDHYTQFLNRDARRDSSAGLSQESSSGSLVQHGHALSGAGNVAAHGVDWWGQPLRFPNWSAENWWHADGPTFAHPQSLHISAVDYAGSWSTFGPPPATPFGTPPSPHFTAYLGPRNAASSPIGGMNPNLGMSR